MSFDELYDEMLDLEFSSRGRHAKADITTADPASAVAAVMAGDVAVHARHARADSVDMVDGASEPAADGERERPTGLARYRTAALVGAGGLACATVGAFLGGLGGYFTVSPAGAHAVASTSAAGPAAPAVHRSAHSSDSTVTPPLPATAFSPASGGLTQAGSGVGSITASPSPNSPLSGLPVGSGPIAGGSSGSGSGSSGSGGGGSTSGTDPTTQTTPPASPTPCQGVCVTVPSLPVTVPTVPTLPVPTPTSPLPLPVTVQTTPSTGTSTSVTAPLPAPTPSTSTTLGPVSVGTSSGSGSTSGGLTLNLG